MSLSEALQDAKPGFANGNDTPDGIFQIRMHNVDTSGWLNVRKKRRVPRDAVPKMDEYLIDADDILFNMTNSVEMVGKSSLVTGLAEPAVFSNHFLRLRTCPDVLLPGYLSRWLLWQYRCGVFAHICRRWVNQATVSRDALLSLELSIPPVDRQRLVVQEFNMIDRLRLLNGRQHTKLEELYGSMQVRSFHIAR